MAFYREHYAKNGKSMNKIYAGVEETIKELSKEHVLAVGTSKLEESARDIIKYFDLEKYFAFVGGAAMDGSRNTKAKVLKYVLENIGEYDSEETYMIGDRFYDIKGAKELNLKSIGVKWGYGEEKELIDAGADYIVNNTDELKELVKRIK
ncbi:phosphoglycolate phosphatase [Peptoniphilus indolicus ATCC 29427]|uniref:Phosphoglycolate phosphatase n=1 Tax=Peptoniphilus indolicus ATCC 29427 TaxID=997350 RepID=G4D0T6_9FIRM|nr:phosphoglycolate phosphatase [Peptoniphilus indolicus ATCC 29427]